MRADLSNLLAGLLAGSLLACHGEPPSVSVELGGLVATAEPWRETGLLDLAEPASLSALRSGWERPKDPASLRWSSGSGSKLEFYRADASAFRLQLRGSAPRSGDAGELVVVSINGKEVGRVRIGATAERVEVAVPAEVARPGRNRLELAFPKATGSTRPRRHVGWRGFQFGDRQAASAPARAGEAPASLELPAGTGLDFYVSLAAGAQLALEGVTARGGARLEVDVECEGEAERRDLVAAARGGKIELRTRAWQAPALCRLSLRAPARGVGAAAVSIAHARLQLPAPHAAVPSAVSPTPLDPANPPNFVLYIVDTLRADGLSCYGNPRPVTPTIDAFAHEGVLFENARAQSSWTRPTVATIFTGLTPNLLDTGGPFRRLPAEVETLPERLKARGYRTAYVTANGNTAATFGFNQGVDAFFQVRGGKGKGVKASWEEVHAAGRKFLDRLGAADRFLLILHTVEPHAPYLPTEASRLRWAADVDPRMGVRKVLDGLPSKRPDREGKIVRQVRDLYEAAVADTDLGFRDLLDELGRRDRLDDTVVLLVADHGEEFFEHGGVEHGRTLFEEQLRIPMIWRLPGSRGGRRLAVPVDQIDVLPTVLELAGVAPPRELPGRSLARALAGGEPPAATASAAWLDRLSWHLEAIRDGDFKLIRNLTPRGGTMLLDERLYELARDRGEREPIRAGRDVRTGFLRAELRFWAMRSGPAFVGGDAEVDEELRRELEALGYLN